MPTQRATSLLRFILDNHPSITKAKLIPQKENDGNPAIFQNFLINTIVVACKEHEQAKVKIDSKLILSVAYPELVTYLTDLRLRSASHYDELLPCTDFRISCLKSSLWETLCERVGREFFIKLVFETSCFLGNGVNKISALVEPIAPVFKPKQKDLCNVGMLHRWKSNIGKERMIDQEIHDLVSLITNLDSLLSKNLPRKLRGLVRVLVRAKKIDSSINYKKMITTLAKVTTPLDTISENAWPFPSVCSFVLSVVYKLFSRRTFGSTGNCGLLSSAIVEFLKNHGAEVKVSVLTSKFNITEIDWLGNSTRITSLQDLASRRQILSWFLSWLFSKFTLKLVRNFWYVTHMNSFNIYFQHETWRSLTDSWLREYSERYLFEVHDIPGVIYNPSSSHGILRLIPKKYDFRPLCVPIKRNDPVSHRLTNSNALRRTYVNYDRDVIRPVRDILRYQQLRLWPQDMSSYPHCQSVSDVGKYLLSFKASLLQKYCGVMPRMFGLKFDMKHSFDNLNQAKVIEHVIQLFQEDPEDEYYFVRCYAHSLNHLSTYSNYKTRVGKRSDISQFDIFELGSASTGLGTIVKDRGQTYSFRKNEIIEIVKNQVLTSTIEIPSFEHRLYRRKRGIFQGLPLLATFCDIVYNALVLEMISPYFKKGFQPKILLRLADDFLFISTEKKECEQIYGQVISNLSVKYGAYVNHDKCRWIEPGMNDLNCEFVGMTISFDTLSIRRNGPINLNHLRSRKSLEATLQYLERILSLKLSDKHLFNLDFVSIEGAKGNIMDVVEPILLYLLSSEVIGKMNSTLAAKKVELFILRLTQAVIAGLKHANDGLMDFDLVIHEIWNTTLSILGRESKFELILYRLSQIFT